MQRVDAVYPPEELAARHEATVQLLVSIGIDGSVTDASVAESGGPAFDRAALAAVRQWKFTPARRGDEALVSRIRIPFRFALPPVEAVPSAPTPAPSSPSPPTGPSASPSAGPVAQAPGASAEGRVPAPVAGASPAPESAAAASAAEETPIDVTVHGHARPPSRGTSDYQLEVGGLASVPR
ncbi:MAG TPA: energy transducer TonB, partial [Polyangiaceae bacterium]|nr:energy transducer TonB [Polyangiaceae bacterium]